MKLRFHSHLFLSVLAILVTVLVAGLWFYIHLWVYGSLDRTKAHLDHVAIVEAQTSQEQKFVDAYQSSSQKWSRLPSYFIPSNQVIGYIKALEMLGSQAGSTVTLGSIDADDLDGKAVGTTGVVRGHLNVAGSWQADMRTLILAETMPYVISIHDVHLTESADASAAPKSHPAHMWSMSFEIDAAMLVPLIASSTSSTP